MSEQYPNNPTTVIVDGSAADFVLTVASASSSSARFSMRNPSAEL